MALLAGLKQTIKSGIDRSWKWIVKKGRKRDQIR